MKTCENGELIFESEKEFQLYWSRQMALKPFTADPNAPEKGPFVLRNMVPPPLEIPRIDEGDMQRRKCISSPPVQFPDPTEDDTNDPLFGAIWNVMRGWDIGVPEWYDGQTGAMGNHVMAILNAVRNPDIGQVNKAYVGKSYIEGGQEDGSMNFTPSN